MEINWIRVSLIAALYTILTVAIAPLSYGPIQFRISELLNILPFIPGYGLSAVFGLSIGCFLSNVISPYGIVDMVIGTLSTVVSATIVYLIRRYLDEKGLVGALITPTLVMTGMVGFMLNFFYSVPSIEAYGGVFIGEFVTATVGGYLLYKALQRVKRW